MLKKKPTFKHKETSKPKVVIYVKNPFGIRNSNDYIVNADSQLLALW